jgi:hypothetical protein
MRTKTLEFKSDKSNYYEPLVNDIVWLFWEKKEIWPAVVLKELTDKSGRKLYHCRFFDEKQ